MDRPKQIRGKNDTYGGKKINVKKREERTGEKSRGKAGEGEEKHERATAERKTRRRPLLWGQGRENKIRRHEEGSMTRGKKLGYTLHLP